MKNRGSNQTCPAFNKGKYPTLHYFKNNDNQILALGAAPGVVSVLDPAIPARSQELGSAQYYFFNNGRDVDVLNKGIN